MEILGKQKRNPKTQMKATPVEEQTGLQALWRDLKARHSALSRAESARKRRNQRISSKTRFSSPGSRFNNQDQAP
ncbi:reverse transcriptase [Plakobranchus ocellatus]|uniref:Reverse transcriptase n=1 Tax=Plakobranchus ocellatus TaxID=259542 RepID=A0AAV3YS90_9GAST|nr:reverse transcriptase [Plakobranchus ocellatus]